MNLVKKQDGPIKALGCADSSKQRRMAGYKQEDTSFPNVHNKSMFITSTINASKGRDVMIPNIPGAFLCALTKDNGAH